MRVALVALLALLSLPAVAACGGAGGAVAPLMDLEFATKQPCKEPDHSDCQVAPRPGESLEFDGVLIWRWDADDCELARVNLSTDDIVITFPPFPRNPSWLAITIEPSEVRVTFQDQWDIQDDDIDPATGKWQIREEYPLHVTITNVGVPTADELDHLASRNGVVEEYLKAVGTANEGFDASFAFENFRLDGSWQLEPADTDSQDTPAPAFGFVAVALTGLAVLLRRRA